MLPFSLVERPSVTRVRQVDPASLRRRDRQRVQPMAGFDTRYCDIVDYIVEITEEIWTDGQIGRIYETYHPDCVVHSAAGVARSVDAVVQATIAGQHAQPGGELHHLNVAWSGDEHDFYTSHLGFARSTNRIRTLFGPATGKAVSTRFVADCISRDNRIHTEWLAYDNGAFVRQTGIELHAAAQIVAGLPVREADAPATPSMSRPRQRYSAPRDTMDGFVAGLYHDIWNLRRLGTLHDTYAPGVIAHWPGARVACNVRGLGSMILALLAAVPDGWTTVEHVCWSDETDGIIVAVRWRTAGTLASGGFFGDCPPGRPIIIPAMTHLRFDTGSGRIVEEWTVFDEVGVLANVYRA